MDAQPTNPSELTTPYGLAEGIAAALKAEDERDWSPVIDWLARHPELAGELARFLATQRGIRVAISTHAGPTPLNPGEEVGGYLLGEEIGRGGMGVVYRAFDPRLNRDVALKRVLTGPAVSPDELARFRFEAEAAASLDHPAIVPVHAFGQENGVPFLVMPLMEGGSLARRLKQLGPDRRLPPRRAAELIRDIAGGVAHAHQRLLMHRDLKPANILLDHDGHPHIADFGLARSLEASRSVSGSVAGTAAYMAPEQARGDRDLTTAVDVHALGAMLFELLIGHPPFGNDDWLATLKRVQEQEAPSLRRLRADVPADLEAICRRCLRKEPADRYPSAQSLANDLTRFLDGEPIGDTRPGLLTSMVRAVSRRNELGSMAIWPSFFWGAASMALTQGAIQAVVWFGWPGWLAHAAFAGYFLGWLVIYWRFVVGRAETLGPVGTVGGSLQLGMFLAALALFPSVWSAHGDDVLPLYPPLQAVIALGIFAHGASRWGMWYLVGFALLLLAAAMPLLPQRLWPAVFAAPQAALMLWLGFRLRRLDREANADAARWRMNAEN